MNQKGITVTDINIGLIDSYFPHYTYGSNEKHKFIGTPPNCYDLENTCEIPSPINLKEMKIELLPIIESSYIFNSFDYIEKLITVYQNLERSAVLGKMKEYILESSDTKHPSKLLFDAWNSVTKQSIKKYISNDGRGIKREFISEFIGLRRNIIFNYSDIFAGVLQNIKNVNISGIRYIPVGYITPDTNVLRQHLWSYHSLKKTHNRDVVQMVAHRKVVIFYDLITQDFIIKVYKEKNTDIYFDNISDTDIVKHLSENTPEYKEVEIKVDSIYKYAPTATRVFNRDKILSDKTYVFSLDNFIKRYDNKILLTLSDIEMFKEPNTLKPMETYPVNYTILCYSIIRTWLHVYSDYFGEKYKLTKNTYFQCYFDKLTGMYTNTYLVG